MTKASNKILSISVAAYNLGEMIRDNLDSVVKSSVKDKIEVIVTNDGSSDNTEEIVNEYVKKYPNTIRLINQKNQGAGSTVNSGIKHATGKYFKMIDGDDWVDTDSLKTIIEQLEKTESDAVITDYLVYNESVKAISNHISYEIKPLEIFNFDDIYHKLDLQMHGTMYKTELLQKNKIKLDNGFYTDIEYVLLPLSFVKTISYINLPLYIYRVDREGQSMSKASMRKNYKQHRLVLERLISEYQSEKKNLSSEKQKYLVDAIGRMANTELRVLLIKESEDKKKEVKDFYQWLEKIDSDIYQSFLTGRKAKVLKLTNFKALKIMERMVEKKFF